jgi:hypothetical protein
VSPIFVRPVREQLEHDRLIRHLQVRYGRKYDVAVNIGDEQTTPLKIGAATFFPDLVLMAGKKLAGLVEVESGESVNNLEAMAQWTHFSRARAPFHLYVPVPAVDAARRFCAANHAKVAELWTYRPALDGFDLVRVFHDASIASVMPERTVSVKMPAPKPAASATVVAAPTASPVPAAKPTSKASGQAPKRPPTSGKKAAPVRKPAARPVAKSASKSSASKIIKKKPAKSRKPSARSR